MSTLERGQLKSECFVKPDSHERHKHKHKVNTKTKHDFSSGTCEDKTTRIFLCFAFCSALGLCLWRSLCRRLDFVPLFCPYAYAYAYAIVWTTLGSSSLYKHKLVKPKPLAGKMAAVKKTGVGGEVAKLEVGLLVEYLFCANVLFTWNRQEVRSARS